MRPTLFGAHTAPATLFGPAPLEALRLSITPTAATNRRRTGSVSVLGISFRVVGNRKRFPDPLTDDELLADERKMELLAAIDRGEVVRGRDGRSTSVNAMHFWNGVPVRFAVGRLRDDELVRMPISGPPIIDVRGRLLLDLIGRGRMSPWFHGQDTW